MTNRVNRRPRRTAPRRTGRYVWVNTSFNTVITDDTVSALALLGAAADFMTFDTTIVQVVIPDLSLVGDIATATTNITARMAFQIAPTLMDPDDFQPPVADSIGPPWMYTIGHSARILASTSFSINFVSQAGGIIRIKAKRRFRENDSTLFLVLQVATAGGDAANMALIGMTRVLLYIP